MVVQPTQLSGVFRVTVAEPFSLTKPRCTKMPPPLDPAVFRVTADELFKLILPPKLWIPAPRALVFPVTEVDPLNVMTLLVLSIPPRPLVILRFVSLT